MKKIIIMAFLLTVVPMLACAGALPADIKTSKGVSSSYFVNATTDATEYSISTGHSQGNRVFFSGSSDAKIYFNDLGDAAFASTDLLQAHVASFESAAGSYDGAL